MYVCMIYIYYYILTINWEILAKVAGLSLGSDHFVIASGVGWVDLWFVMVRHGLGHIFMKSIIIYIFIGDIL